MIVIYVYTKASGEFLYKGTGIERFLLHDIKAGEDYTTEPYPSTGKNYKWIDSKWVADNTAN